MADFTIKRNDLLPVLEAVLKDADGQPVNLTDAVSCAFHMRLESDQSMTVEDGVCSFDADRLTGKVLYAWAAGDPVDTAVEGTYLGEFEITWPASKIQTYPSIGYIDIEIVEDLS